MSDPFGRTAIGVNQPPGGGSNYPLIAPSVDIQQLFGDFYLSYEDNVCAFTAPFRIAWLHGFGTNSVTPPDGFPTPVNPYDVVVVDANDQVVFDSTTATYSSTVWAGRLLIIQWEQTHQVCRCTIYTTWPAELTPIVYDDYITPVDGTLDPRTCNRLPGRVRSIVVGLQRFTGDIVFESGFNITQTITSPTRVDGGRFVNRLNMNAVPGAGMGQQPGCISTQPLVRRINLVQPDSAGNFILQLDSCFRTQLPLHVNNIGGASTAQYSIAGYTHDQAKSAIMLHSDCHPCCECSYFVRTYRGLKRQWNIWQGIATQAQGVRNSYDGNRQRWLDSAACRTAHALQVVALTEPACSTFVGTSYCNPSKCCIAPVEVRMTFQGYTSGVLNDTYPSLTVKEAHIEATSTNGEQTYHPQVTGPILQFTADQVNPQSSMLAKVRVCTPCNATQSVRATITVHTPDPPPATGTGEVCILPTPAVPSDVAAIWAAQGIPASPTVRAVIQRTVPLNPAAVAYPCNC